MQSDGGFDGRQSPASQSTSQYSVVSAPGYYFAPGTAINNVEPHAQRQIPAQVPRRVSVPAASVSYSQSSYGSSPYQVSPGAQSMTSYYSSPMQPTPPPQQISSLYYQRPLPQVSDFVLELFTRLTSSPDLSTTTPPCFGDSYSILGCQPLATPPLHLPEQRCHLSSIPGSLHLSDMPEGVLAAQQLAHPLSQSHGREALQVPTRGLWKGFQCAKQHEAS
jgi:hypothetical protein